MRGKNGLRERSEEEREREKLRKRNGKRETLGSKVHAFSFGSENTCPYLSMHLAQATIIQ